MNVKRSLGNWNVNCGCPWLHLWRWQTSCACNLWSFHRLQPPVIEHCQKPCSTSCRSWLITMTEGFRSMDDFLLNGCTLYIHVNVHTPMSLAQSSPKQSGNGGHLGRQKWFTVRKGNNTSKLRLASERTCAGKSRKQMRTQQPWKIAAPPCGLWRRNLWMSMRIMCCWVTSSKLTGSVGCTASYFSSSVVVQSLRLHFHSGGRWCRVSQLSLEFLR